MSAMPDEQNGRGACVKLFQVVGDSCRAFVGMYTLEICAEQSVGMLA
jgi:hypothetical protein